MTALNPCENSGADPLLHTPQLLKREKLAKRQKVYDRYRRNLVRHQAEQRLKAKRLRELREAQQVRACEVATLVCVTKGRKDYSQLLSCCLNSRFRIW